MIHFILNISLFFFLLIAIFNSLFATSSVLSLRFIFLLRELLLLVFTVGLVDDDLDVVESFKAEGGVGYLLFLLVYHALLWVLLDRITER